MKRAAVLLCALMFISLTCFGQEPVPPGAKGGNPRPPSSGVNVKRMARPWVKPLEIKGLIDTITMAEPAKGTRPEISVTGHDGRHYVFIVRTITTIYGRDWKPVTLDKLEKGQKVRIQYIVNKDGMLVALSIKPAMEQKSH